jgi:NitT/TauT family transport system permease protein
MSLPTISARWSSAGATPLSGRWLGRRLGAGLAPLLTFIVILAVWELACRAFAVPSFVLPMPSAIVRAGSDLAAAQWRGHFLSTLQVVLAGYAIAIAVSLPLAMFLSTSRLLARTVLPLLVIVQSTPIVAIAPIIVVLVGTGVLPRIIITFMIAFMPLVISTATGLQSAPAELIKLSRSLRAGRRREYLQIRLPCAAPYIFSGLKVSITLAVIGSVVGEFVASEQGLGYLILISTSFFKVAQSFAALGVLVVSSLALFQIVSLAQRLLFPWSVPKPGATD